MSQFKFQRKRTLGGQNFKLHSQQSKQSTKRYSILKSFHQNLAKRRFPTVQNSPNNKNSSIQKTILPTLEKAKQAYHQKNIPKAIQMFKSLSKIYPKNPSIWYYLGSCFMNQENYQKSIYQFNNCLLLDPNYDKNIYLYQAINFKNLKKYRNSLKSLSQGLSRFPNFDQAIFYKGKIHMKLYQWQQAVKQFTEYVQHHRKNQLALTFLAENLRKLNKFDDALKKLDQASALNSKNKQVIWIKRISLLIEMKRFKDAQISIDKLLKNNIQNSQLYYYKAYILAQMKDRNQSIIYLENSLSIKSSQHIIINSIKLYLKIIIQQKYFFEGQHLLKRIQKLQISQQIVFYGKILIQAINDIIKRKFDQSKIKFQKMYKRCNQKQLDSNFYKLQSLPYYAYNLFVLHQFKKSLDIYQALLNQDPNQINQNYNKLLCQGFLYNKQKNYQLASQKFTQASLFKSNKIEPYFFKCINHIQIYQKNPQKKQKIFKQIQQIIKQTDKINHNCSLFYFYQSLIKLYRQQQALQLINKAIKMNQQPISQYNFIKALVLSINHQNLQALDYINKAIQIDQSIPQFYKQRSKYYFLLQRYGDAVEDAKKVLEIVQQDQQVKLLLTFYNYMEGNYLQSYHGLNNILETSTAAQEKFNEFKQAIQMHLGCFNKIGVVGPLLTSIVNGQSINQQYLNQFELFMQQRIQYGQFSIYFYHMLIACYYVYSDKQSQALPHFFIALEQIQTMLIESEQDSIQKNIKTQIMLNQVKFNIIICSLMINNLQQTVNLIDVFKKQAQNKQLVQSLNLIQNTIKNVPDENANSDKIQTHELNIFEDYNKLSDSFPLIRIQIPGYVFLTRLLLFYPPKMKFNIHPQFDKNFLFNFDLQKVDSKLSPPWLRVNKNQQLLFTQEICNQSIQISNTQKSISPILINSKKIINIKQKFRLDSKLENKLQKIIKK